MSKEYDLITRLREGRTSGTDLQWITTPIHHEAADAIELLAKERDNAEGARAGLEIGYQAAHAEIRRLEAELTKARQQRDLAEIKRVNMEQMMHAELDQLYAELAKAREELEFFRPAIEHISKLTGTYVHVAINAVATATTALKEVEDRAAGRS